MHRTPEIRAKCLLLYKQMYAIIIMLPPALGDGNLLSEVPKMARFSLSCVSRSSDRAVWSRFGLSASDVLRAIPAIDCGAEYHIIDYRSRRCWVVYHGSRSRWVRRETF